MTSANLKVKSILRSAALFGRLEDAVVEELASGASALELAPGDFVVRQGEVGDALFVIGEGKLGVFVSERFAPAVEVATLGAGELIGEIQAIAGGVRSASVVAETKCVLARVPRASFDAAALRFPELLQAISSLVSGRLERTMLALALPPILGPLDGSALRELMASASFVRLHAGELLFRQGDPPDAWYVMGSGRVRVLQTDAQGRERALAELGRGESIGETALLSHGLRTASVLAVRDTVLAVFKPESFEKVVHLHPGAALSIARTVVTRMSLAKPAPSIASCLQIVIARATPGIDVASLSRSLAGALQPIGRALVLGPGRFMGEMSALPELPEDHPLWLRFPAWLEERAADHRFLILECADLSTPWGKRVAREADELVLAAEFTAEPEPLGPESVPAHVRRTLLLVHGPDAPLPRGTARWLRAFSGARHLHLRSDRAEDFRRAARTLAGRAVGLVLGAGGARGAAHIGSLRALAEAKVEIDSVGGTSAGALAGALFAMGHSPDQLAELNARGTKQRVFGDYVLPTSSLLRGRRFEKFLRGIFAETRIEDLWLPFFCTSCDTSIFEEATHDRGELVPRLLASCAIPGVLPPQLIDGHMHVDGALTCALPGKVMRERIGRGTLIAVDVSTERKYWAPEPHYPVSWSMIWRRWFPTVQKPARPLLPELIIRAGSLVTANNTEAVARDAQLFLRPPVEQFGTLDAAAAGKIDRIAFEYAKGRLLDWSAPIEARGPKAS